MRWSIRSTICRGRAGAIPTRRRNQCGARCARWWPSAGARSPCASCTCCRTEAGEEQDMIGRLNHVAIAVRDIDQASAVYRKTLAAEVSGKVPLPEHGVTTVFVTLPNTKIEL